MLLLLLLVGSAVAQRGHYIVDYQRLPLYQEFYLSPGVYRPLFPAKEGSAAASAHEARRVDSPGDPQARHHKHHGHVFQQKQQIQNHDQTQQQAAAQVQQQVAQPLVQQQPIATIHQEQTTSALHQEQPVVVQHENAVVVATQEQPSVVVTQQEEQQSDSSAPVLKYQNSMTQDGSYSYKYETADGLMREESSVMEPAEDGRMVATVRGSYSYPGPDGRTIRVDYVADEGGFRASGDHIPQTLTDTIYNFKYVVP